MSRDYRSLTEVWDRKEFKLTLLVVEASGLSSSSSSSSELPSCFVRVSVGKSVSSTRTVKASSEPVFKEFVFHTVNSIQTCLSVSFEVLAAAKLGKDRFLGMAALDVLRLAPETCYDFWLPLQPRPEERRRSSMSVISLRGSTHTEAVSGKLRVRALLSSMSGSRPRVGPLVQSYAYDYDSINFKTGDVLAFSGVGMLPTLTKLLSNSDVSALGIVLVLPNLYTQRLERYIAEVTPNTDGMIDAFLERPKRAVCIFRLYERLHQFHGGSIRLYPLKSEVKLEAAENMMSWIWQVHSKGGLPLDLVGPQVQFIKKELGFKLERPEIQAELSELSSSLFIVRCLSLCGQLSNDASSQTGGLPAFVLQLSCFGDPLQVRTWIPDPKTVLSQSPYPLQQSSQASSPRADSAPMSPSLASTTMRRNASLQQQAASNAQAAAAVSPSTGASPAVTPTASKKKLSNTPPPPPSVLSKQVSSLSYKPASNVLPEEADVLTVDVDSLINDLRAVELDARMTTGGGDASEDDNDSGEDDRSPSSSPPKSWGGSFGRRSTPRSASARSDAPASPTSGVAKTAVTAVAVPPEEQEPVFDDLPDLGDLNVENVDFSLLEPPPTISISAPPVTVLDPHAEVVLNLVNYLPGMELVRFSEGSISIEDASVLIRYKHEHLGGLFWSFSELKSCVATLGLSMKLLDSFRKPPFPPAVLSLLAPQVASRVRCEPLFDNGCFGHMIDIVSSARTFVCLCLPELSHLSLIAALSLAAGRGVHVRVLVCGEGPAPVVQGCQVVQVRPSTVLSSWTPEKRKQLAQSGVPDEFLALQDMSKRALPNQSFPVALRRSMLVVDGVRSVVGSMRGASTNSHEAAVAMEGASAARLVHKAFASLWMCMGGHG